MFKYNRFDLCAMRQCEVCCELEDSQKQKKGTKQILGAFIKSEFYASKIVQCEINRFLQNLCYISVIVDVHIILNY